MSKFSVPPGGILDTLTATGLVENHGIRQKDPRRVAAGLRQQARARRARREAKEALAPPIVAPPRRRPGFKPIGQRRYDRVIRVMEPGLWYARGDLARAAGFDRDARGYVTMALLYNALATRSRPGGDPGTKTCPAPHWLYQLTEKGEALRSLLVLL